MVSQSQTASHSRSRGGASGHCLVLGGARSGKSRFAEGLLAEMGGQRVYIATAEPDDEEMRLRIRDHQARRGAGWRTVEEPLDLAPAIAGAGEEAVLVDCLTLWLANLMRAGRDLAGAFGALESALYQARAPVVLVSNEVGLGIVPDNALARRFRDEAGRLNQAVAAIADRVFFIAAGLPLTLKDKVREGSQP
jgi:adenosylcobinamide kinase/adenosylcobinamide-phosphate guanylyltransferase